MIQNEINDLYDYGFKIVQNSKYFKFSLDSIILADFIKINYSDKKVLDMCTGNAPIPIILSSNEKIEIYGMELQKEISELAQQSIEINSIQNVKIINDNVKNLKNYFPGNNFDIITCNPPYFKYDDNSIINKNKIKSIARHEIEITLAEIVSLAEQFLKSKGRFYIVHRTERIIEIFNLLNKNNFGIKNIQFVYYNKSSNCSMVIIEAKKNSKNDVKVMKPIYAEDYRGDQ